MVVDSRSRDFLVDWTRETFSTPDKPDVDDRLNIADRLEAAAQSSREVSAVQPTAVFSGKVYFMKNLLNIFKAEFPYKSSIVQF